jgi:hypothetical protein
MKNESMHEIVIKKYDLMKNFFAVILSDIAHYSYQDTLDCMESMINSLRIIGILISNDENHKFFVEKGIFKNIFLVYNNLINFKISIDDSIKANQIVKIICWIYSNLVVHDDSEFQDKCQELFL